jgi:carbonic anhydrase/acetyltransferase-like protein (isoleucine patch superfamily)
MDCPGATVTVTIQKRNRVFGMARCFQSHRDRSVLEHSDNAVVRRHQLSDNHGRTGYHTAVHACTIDNEVLVGMGSVMTEVGARSIVGANALITIGTKIPPGSLVLGSPAKIRRQLSLDEQKDIARWAWSYVETAKQYREFC